MQYIIENYIQNLTKDDVNDFALKSNIYLTNAELDFTYHFIKEKYGEIINNPYGFDFSKYRDRFSNDSYVKIEALIKKYSSYL